MNSEAEVVEEEKDDNMVEETVEDAVAEVKEQESTNEKEEVQQSEKRNFSTLQRSVSSSNSDKEGCNVHVVCRVRPLNLQEVERKDLMSVNFPGDGAVLVDSQGKDKTFSFHGVFEPGCNQLQVFENCGMQHLLDKALDGYACTAFAFGQTGSGKTYTMTGPVTPENRKLAHERSLRDVDAYGLIQYSFAYLIDAIANKQDVTYSIRASYLEIYNEQVQDLLNLSSYDMAQVRWSASLGFYVENLFVKEIETLDDLMDVLESGMKNRAVAEHNVNDHSSRSHSILTVYLDSEVMSEDMLVTKRGKVSFVDLAGSEKVKDTGSTGDMLIEATNINRSLLTLGNCISALSDPKKRTGHIPFRDSKLTKLLADGLGGSGITLMIACVTPSSYNLSETFNTLRYAKRARKIKNKPIVRIDPREHLILKLQKDMKMLKQENRFLRDQLEFPQREKPRFPIPNTADVLQKRVPLEPLKQVPNSVIQDNSDVVSPPERAVSDNSLYEMLQEYMVENEALRNENQNLLSQHNLDEREQRLVVGENDKLVRKLEDLSRLMMSSPFYGSTFFSRTTSGRSNQSFQTWSASLSPFSQPFYSYNPKGKPDGFVQYDAGAKPPNAPMLAWNSTPPVVKHPNGLPPLKRSPPSLKKNHPNRSYPLNPSGASQPKWSKGASYATQFKKKLTLKQAPLGNAVKSPKKPSEAMQDFPMRDFEMNGNKAYFPYQDIAPTVSADAPDNGHPSPRNHTHLRHLHANQQARFGKTGYHQMQSHHMGGGALPDEAYKPQEISNRGMRTKELSATSLRKLNNQMRQEMRVLDDQINSYQKAMTQQTKKKLTAT